MSTLEEKGPGADVKSGAGEASRLGRRGQALARVQARRDFGSHAIAYLVINAFLVVTWALTGAGYFWPGWVLGGWAAALTLHAWDAFVRRPITDADVEEEMRRMS